MLTFKRFIIILYDLITIPLAWFGAYWLRSNLSGISPHLIQAAVRLLPLVIIVQAVSFWVYGLYRGEWRFASIPDMMRICKAVIVGAIALLIILYFSSTHFFHIASMPPRSIIPIYIILLLFFLGGARLFFRWLKDFQLPQKFQERVLIVGAGFAGESLVRELRRDVQRRYYPFAFVDDNGRKQGVEILGVRVIGRIKDIPNLTKKYGIQQVLIAIPSADAKTMRNIVEFCNKAKVNYKTLPGLSALISGEVSINDLRAVSLEDLLGREPINLHELNLYQGFENKVILISGGGGSIGSELCRQIAAFKPRELIVFDHSEYNLYQIELFLKQIFPNLKAAFYLQDITDQQGVERLIAQYKPEIIFHAAAYKHVPILEEQPLVAVKNNIFGTKTLANIAVAHKVGKFILISTDKAVNPSNIMGATKRVAEIFCQNLNAQSTTNFITVRFGNVLGSAGSVVPLFQKQLEAGGPLTVTHPDITRYFMTIPEACQLILRASLLGHGGEIFVLDMGVPVKIAYLAEQMIKLSGKDGKIEIKYTGLRPGEKLYEELFHKAEKLESTEYEKILRSQARKVDWIQFLQVIDELQQTYDLNQHEEIIALLYLLIPEGTFSQTKSQKNDTMD